MDFLIIAGLSGAGKTVAVHSLEDIGFYCVDNLPAALITTFYDLCRNSNDDRMERVALVTNIRSEDDYRRYSESLEKLRSEKKYFKVLFLDASESVLLTRYKSTRRKHPLAGKSVSTTAAAVGLEQTLLENVKLSADYLIDTTNLSASQLKERVLTLFIGDSRLGFSVACMSFGFKYGLPLEADLVFDVRCLPNPFYIEELKLKTGLDQEVRDYVLKWEQTKELYKKIEEYIDYALPLYIKEGKSQLVVAFGCTGGQHRSVTLAGRLYDHLLETGQPATLHHRDIRKA